MLPAAPPFAPLSCAHGLPWLAQGLPRREFVMSNCHAPAPTCTRCQKLASPPLDFARSRLAAGREHELASPRLGPRLSAGSFAIESLPLGRWELASPPPRAPPVESSSLGLKPVARDRSRRRAEAMGAALRREGGPRGRRRCQE
nr:unnamed protein product [Digitaria exilis]